MEAPFSLLLASRIGKISRTLGEKEGEYAKGGNRFHNFDLASTVSGNTPEQALKGITTECVSCGSISDTRLGRK